jgi:hypothetical protein
MCNFKIPLVSLYTRNLGKVGAGTGGGGGGGREAGIGQMSEK